jgi:hypothetical protein
MLEWDDVTRHWWRYDKERIAMVHRASGEVIVYRGSLPDDGWHRFDYEHDDDAYPLAVQPKRVAYPNPSPNRWNMPPWNDGGTPILRPWIWRVDHERSASLWRTEAGAPETHPPYWLWCRADIAMMEVALVWPRKTPVGDPAEEVAINAGWLNGAWTTGLYRRFYWSEPLRMTGYRPWNSAHALPLSEHYLTPRAVFPSQWSYADSPAIDGFGKELPASGMAMIDAVNGIRIAKHAGPERYHGASYSNAGALVTTWRGLYLTTAISAGAGLAWASANSDQIVPAVKWESSLTVPGVIGWTQGTPNPDVERWLGKTIVTNDSFFQQPRGWQYNSAVVDRVASSYRLWRSCSRHMPAHFHFAWDSTATPRAFKEKWAPSLSGVALLPAFWQCSLN